MIGPLPSFDRAADLEELLRALPPARLKDALDRTIGGGWRIVAPCGRVLKEGGDLGAAATIELTLTVEIDVVGRLVAPAGLRQGAEAAAQWLHLVLAGARRYQMASDLHLEAVHADYEALQAKHSALQASEARYRTLSAELERRVLAQVAVIERTQRQMFQAAQLAAMGSLAGGMAHEINNPIGFIRSNLSSAARYLAQLAAVVEAFRRGDGAQAQADCARFDIDFVLADFDGLLAESAAGADRVAQIVGSLKAFSSVDRAVGPADLNEAVRNAAALLQAQLPDGIAVTLDLHALPPRACDLARLTHALYALLHNARQALAPEGGTIAVASGVAGGEIRIAVRDDGCGMPDTVREHIFEPFFTTRGVGAGMGLGLTVANDIVRAHHGRIEVESAPAAGTTATICLPLEAQAGTGGHA